MRADRLAGRWQMSWALEASPNDLTVVSLPSTIGHMGTAQTRSLSKTCSKTGMGFLLLEGSQGQYIV